MWCMWGLCWSSEERACCTGSQAHLPERSSTSTVWGCEAWCKWFKPSLLAMCCLIKLVFVQGQEKEMVPASSLVLGEGIHACCCLESPPRRANNLPRVSQESVRSLPSSCPFLGHIPTWQCSAPWTLSREVSCIFFTWKKF